MDETRGVLAVFETASALWQLLSELNFDTSQHTTGVLQLLTVMNALLCFTRVLQEQPLNSAIDASLVADVRAQVLASINEGHRALSDPHHMTQFRSQCTETIDSFGVLLRSIDGETAVRFAEQLWTT
jgi:hypothetical protein